MSQRSENLLFEQLEVLPRPKTSRGRIRPPEDIGSPSVQTAEPSKSPHIQQPRLSRTADHSRGRPPEQKVERYSPVTRIGSSISISQTLPDRVATYQHFQQDHHHHRQLSHEIPIMFDDGSGTIDSTNVTHPIGQIYASPDWKPKGNSHRQRTIHGDAVRSTQQGLLPPIRTTKCSRNAFPATGDVFGADGYMRMWSPSIIIEAQLNVLDRLRNRLHKLEEEEEDDETIGMRQNNRTNVLRSVKLPPIHNSSTSELPNLEQSSSSGSYRRAELTVLPKIMN